MSSNIGKYQDSNYQPAIGSRSEMHKMLTSATTLLEKEIQKHNPSAEEYRLIIKLPKSAGGAFHAKSIGKKELSNLFARTQDKKQLNALTPREIEILSELTYALEELEIGIYFAESNRVVCKQKGNRNFQAQADSSETTRIARVQNLGETRLAEQISQDLQAEARNIYTAAELTQLLNATAEDFSEGFDTKVADLFAQYPLSERVTEEAPTAATQTALSALREKKGEAKTIADLLALLTADVAKKTAAEQARLLDELKDEEAAAKKIRNQYLSKELDEKQQTILSEWAVHTLIQSLTK